MSIFKRKQPKSIESKVTKIINTAEKEISKADDIGELEEKYPHIKESQDLERKEKEKADKLKSDIAERTTIPNAGAGIRKKNSKKTLPKPEEAPVEEKPALPDHPDQPADKETADAAQEKPVSTSADVVIDVSEQKEDGKKRHKKKKEVAIVAPVQLPQIDTKEEFDRIKKMVVQKGYDHCITCRMIDNMQGKCCSDYLNKWIFDSFCEIKNLDPASDIALQVRPLIEDSVRKAM